MWAKRLSLASVPFGYKGGLHAQTVAAAVCHSIYLVRSTIITVWRAANKLYMRRVIWLRYLPHLDQSVIYVRQRVP
jgi:hypothetical protein